MSGINTSYRAVEANTKVRRLAYISALVDIIGRKDVNEDRAYNLLIQWSLANSYNLKSYVNQQGEVTSAKYPARRYIQFAYSTGLLTRTMATCRVAHQGLLLYELLQEHRGLEDNPFFLDNTEKIFYAFHLLSVDADILLTVFDLTKRFELKLLKELQSAFRDIYLQRLGQKVSNCDEGPVRQKLLERRALVEHTWKNPERYAEHLVPTRLNWMLDLGLLEPKPFNKHMFILSDMGRLFDSVLPLRIETDGYSDIDDDWLQRSFFSKAVPGLALSISLRSWTTVDQNKLLTLIRDELESAFQRFQMIGTQAVPLDIAIQHVCIQLAARFGILIDESDLTQLLTEELFVAKLGIQVRILPRPNESYIARTSVTHTEESKQ